MSDQNRQLARRFLDAFEKGDAAMLETIVADDILDHNAPPGAAAGRKGLLEAVAMYRGAFPDLKISVERVLADGDGVAVYGSVSGTNTGPMMGIPSTGRHASFPYMDMYRVAGGRIVETWHVEDIAGMLRQLGLAQS
jgi:steroid delta-isomerase-like uncharacterized protein